MKKIERFYRGRNKRKLNRKDFKEKLFDQRKKIEILKYILAHKRKECYFC